VSTPDVAAPRSLGIRIGDQTSMRLQGVPSAVGKVLRRRYFLVEKARNASIVGILVGTLGVAGYLDVVDRVRELAKQCAVGGCMIVICFCVALKFRILP